MTVNYYLDTTSSAIMLVVGHRGKKFRKSTGHIIKPAIHWNKDDQKVKSSFKDYQSINGELESMERKVKKIISDYKIYHSTVPTLDFVKNELSKDPNEDNHKTINKLLEMWVKNAEVNNKKGTHYTYKSFKNVVEEFQKTQKISLTIGNINSETIELYKSYLNKEGNCPDTIRNKLHLFKMALNFGKKKKYLETFDEELFNMKAPKSYGKKIYLSDSEIDSLFKLKDFDEEVDEVIRDGFLFQCYTGLRLSDLKSLKPINVKDGLINIVMHKTERPLFVPLSGKAKELLAKYEGKSHKCFPLPVKEKYNKRIKDICKKAEIKENMPIVRYEGTKRIEEVLPKHLLVASHTGRRSFATNYILKGGQIEILSKLLGHYDISVTQKYFKDTPEVIAALSLRIVEAL